MEKKEQNTYMTVNEVVKITGVSKRTLQYYDSIGLLPAARRTSAGYRLFSIDSIETLETINHYKSMGFELKEIKEILYNDEYDIVAALRRRKNQLTKESDDVKEKLKKVEIVLKDMLDLDVT